MDTDGDGEDELGDEEIGGDGKVIHYVDVNGVPRGRERGRERERRVVVVEEVG